MSVETVEDLEDRIREWTTNRSTRTTSSEYIWGLIDEVIDEVMAEFDPYFCFTFGTVTRSSSNHFIGDGAPTPRSSGVVVTDAQVEAGSVPDNTEYLEYMLFPSGLIRPLDVYYGTLSDNNEIDHIGYDEFLYRRENDEGGFASGVSGSTPTHYTTFGEAFLLLPTPPFSCTISAYGVYRPDRIEGGGNTNRWITKVPDLLRYGVILKLIMYDMAEEDIPGITMLSGAYKRQLDALKKRSRLTTYRTERSRMRKYGTRRT
jgi:hypothetical protein